MLPDLVQVATRVVRALEVMDVPYLIGGSLASAHFGIPRSTRDVDLMADLRPEHVVPLVDALQEEFYIDADMIGEAIQRKSSFNLAQARLVQAGQRLIRSSMEGCAGRAQSSGGHA